MRIFNKYFWKDLWYDQISSRVRPRQKWVYKCLPRQWQDKDSVVRLVLFECIIHFVEREKCFETIVWTWGDGSKKVVAKIREIYDWIKVVRPQMEAKMWDAYPPMRKIDVLDWVKASTKEEYESKYGEVDRLEKYIDDKDTEYLQWIVVNRSSLWT